ncbi:hypothetical protein A8L34_14415 [Bacillus sp. FJAT-27264]|uniref:hypothetical protein n=1 Tax=Paenibacillus sp. (strain DSM 101736 / FJAT-27264) TaxID=1850362 RepID=UPI000807DDD8|nr:hypothetical protein [Bacillus sp. FJAT-27264]OBZ11549.1 hypothetical protein A8L34_14415 [Bacillus sp. FJAT-27264]
MKNTMMKVTLAATMLVGGILGQGAVNVSNADAAAATTTKVQPIMTDNLSKYGLKKDVELPVTVTAGGLNYTLEKIMIYDAKSNDALALTKKYGYNINGAQYFIWTKITIENKSSNLVQQNVKDLSEKWALNFGDLSKGDAFAAMPKASYYKPNSKEALWDWSLKPGEKLSTYQGYLYTGEINYFKIRSINKKKTADAVYVVEPRGN